MKTWRVFASCALIGAGLGGCATVQPMTAGGMKVQQIDAATAKECRFLQVAQFTTTMYGVGKDPAIVQTTGANGLRNAVAAAGGNAYVLLTHDADWFMGHVSYTGDAYKCPLDVINR